MFTWYWQIYHEPCRYFKKSNIKEWWVSIVKSLHVLTFVYVLLSSKFYWTHLFTLIRIFFKATCGLIPSTQLCRNFLSPLIVNICVRRSDRNTLTFNFRIQCPKSLRQAKVQIFWGGHISFSNLTILKYEMSKIFWDLFKMLWSKYVLRISELYENFVLAKHSAVKSQFILSKYR